MPNTITRQRGADSGDIQILKATITILIKACFFLHYPHNSRPRPASAAALLKQEDAATSAAGALDADSKGSDATAE
jgi:hypothetical protein